jgi:hypothetical protein
VNEIVQAILLLSGPAGAAVVWWLKRGDDSKLRGRVDECERERAVLRERVTNLEGSVSTLTALLKREINIG